MVKAKKGKVAVAVKKEVAYKEPEFKVRKIRMLMSLANQSMAYTMGRSYKVPEEVSVETAQSWLRGGVAEEDTSLEAPEETK